MGLDSLILDSAGLCNGVYHMQQPTWLCWICQVWHTLTMLYMECCWKMCVRVVPSLPATYALAPRSVQKAELTRAPGPTVSSMPHSFEMNTCCRADCVWGANSLLLSSSQRETGGQGQQSQQAEMADLP